MINIQGVSYKHPDKDLLLGSINLVIRSNSKAALIGNNGTGKSTLLKIIAGELRPSAGQVIVDAQPYYVPQIFGQFNDLTVAEALRIDDKIDALRQILSGYATDHYLQLLGDDWDIEERSCAALAHWDLSGVALDHKMRMLSGGQKTKVFLAGIFIHKPKVILLDEPTNHLDTGGRQLLQDLITSTSATLLIVSHDRKLLRMLDPVCELSMNGVAIYGGNYDFYAAQKEIESTALGQEIKAAESALRRAREKERETMERQQKLDARGKKKQQKAGLPTIMQHALRDSAEKSTTKVKAVHAGKISDISTDLKDLRSTMAEIKRMKFGFADTSLHKGKVLFTADAINFNYQYRSIWPDNISIRITSGERLALKGANGSGKTTLINIILGRLSQRTGTVYRVDFKAVYIDQDYSIIQDDRTVFEQANHFNVDGLEEHVIKIRLNRFLFSAETWNKSCNALSGGEKMRLMLCCLTIGTQSPDVIVLDEPTNNLDMQNIAILTAAINEYKGTLIVVSHDEDFLKEVSIHRTIQL
jgi:ATPase subunit of ABC transporter with duplicated ATPase domains